MRYKNNVFEFCLISAKQYIFICIVARFEWSCVAYHGSIRVGVANRTRLRIAAPSPRQDLSKYSDNQFMAVISPREIKFSNENFSNFEVTFMSLQLSESTNKLKLKTVTH